MSQNVSRRTLLAGMAGAATAASALRGQGPGQGRFTICAFSKHFQWTDLREASEICAGIGYEGMDITLRPGGHVLPERVTDDLPKAVETCKKAGLTVPMTTADIVDTKSKHCEAMIKTMASLGIKRYRWGGFRYAPTGSLPEQLAEIKPRVKDLAAMNRQYGVCAMYHTHSGIGQVGAAQWDLYLLIKDYDTDAVGVNYDLGHATVEGGYGGWIHSARLMMPYLKGVALKDFRWKQNEKGNWVPGWCALGQGMVNFKLYLSMLKEARFSGPLQLHMEYPELGGADTGKTQFNIPKEKLLAIFKRDMDTLKTMLRAAGMLA